MHKKLTPRNIIYAIGTIGTILLLSPYFGINIISKKADLNLYSSDSNPLRENLTESVVREPRRAPLLTPDSEIRAAPSDNTEAATRDTTLEGRPEPPRSRGLSEIEDLLRN